MKKGPEFDVAVVGAGIIGVTIAEQLQHLGKNVVLVDRDAPGEGCSKGNAGHFATDIITPLASFDTLLKVPRLLLNPSSPLSIKASYFPKLLPWLYQFAKAALPKNSESTIAALKQLNRPSISKFKQLLERTNQQNLMTQKGALTVFSSATAEKANRKHMEFVRRHGINVEMLNLQSLTDLEPDLCHSLMGALYFPDTAHSVDPFLLLKGLFEHFLLAGGQFQQSHIDSIEITDSQMVCLKNQGSSIYAKQVIIAAGAWSNTLAKTLGYHFPLEAERGYHLMLPEPNVKLNRPVTSFEHSFVMTPMNEGLRLAGTVEFAGLDAPPNYQRADNLYKFAKILLPELNLSEPTKWMGCRPSLPDSLPIIGRAPKHQNVIFAFGHQHLGLTQAAVTAELVGDIVTGIADENEIKAFRASRFY